MLLFELRFLKAEVKTETKTTLSKSPMKKPKITLAIQIRNLTASFFENWVSS